MSKKMWYSRMAGLMVTILVISACGPAATEAPVATEAPATEAPATEMPATEAPATEAPAAYDGLMVESPDCDYGGEVKSIEAVDEFTVKITLCVPDPAIPSKLAFTSFA